MTPGGIPVMARVVAPFLVEPFRRPLISALFSHRSFASKPTKTKEEAVAPKKKKIKQVKPPKTKKTISRAQMVHIENNLLFGKLLETNKEKLRRLKKEAKNTSIDPEEAQINISTNSKNTPGDFSKEWDLQRALQFHPDRVTVRYRMPTDTNDTTLPVDPTIASVGDTIVSPDAEAATDPKNTNIAEGRRLNNNANQDESVIRIVPSVVPISFPYPTNNSKAKLPSVTRILGDTMPPEQRAVLEKWEKRMREKLGDEGFRVYKEGILNNGRDLHANIREILNGTPEDHLSIPERIEGHWRSLRNVLAGMKQVHALESHVAHPSLEYCGIVDCVAQFRDKLVLVDWKTSEKPKPVVAMTYDTPLQIAAYIGAVNEDPNYSIKIREGLIVVAYQSGSICETFFMTENDVAIAWDKWMKRLNLYRQQQESTTSSIKSE